MFGLLVPTLLPLSVSAGAPAKIVQGGDAMQGWQRHFVGIQDEAPAYIRAIVQSRDGFIWFGAADGLYRYDGVRFQRMAPSSRGPLQSDAILSLMTMPNGDLWVGHDWGGLSLYRGGRHLPVLEPKFSTITMMRTNKKGVAWAIAWRGRDHALLRLEGGRWREATIFAGHSYVSDAAVGADGRLWMLEGGRLLYAVPGDRQVRQVRSPPLPNSSLLVDGTDQPWLIRQETMQRLPFAGTAPVPRRPAGQGSGMTASDGPTAFWAAEGGNLLVRYRFDPRTGRSAPLSQWRSAYWMADSGLDAHDMAMLVDRQGSLWVGTSLGVERFTPSAFTTVLRSSDGVAGEAAVPYAIRDGRGDVWLRKGRELFKAADDGSLIAQPISLPVDYTPCGSTNGGLWVPDGKRNLVVFGGPKRPPVPLAGSTLLGNSAFGHCAEDSLGRIWANERTGLLLLGAGGARQISLGEDSGSSVLDLIPDGDGVLGYVGRRSVWRSDGTRSQAIWQPRSMTLGLVDVMYRTPRYLLLGGDRGVARVIDGRIEMLSRERVPELTFTSGITQTPQGDTWLQTIRGIVRIRTELLDRAFRDPKFVPPLVRLDAADGLPGTAAYLNMASLLADRHGRIWFTANNGVVRYDPDGDTRRRIPLEPVIVDAEADGRSYPVTGALTLPAGTARLRIGFTAPSSISPEKLRFRYRLSGVDAGWVNAGAERAAVYTSLPYGAHRFEVAVSDAGGRWSEQPAAIEIAVRAHFYQHWWFRLACGLGLLLAAFLVYRWRLDLASRQLRSRAAERAFERDRIARDLHDTLLQSIQGLVLRFQSVASGMGGGDPNRKLLENTLDQADELIAEGKQRVLGLRTDEQPADLPAMLGQALTESPFHIDVAKTVHCSGTRSTVVAGVAHEIREIVGEALFNAARHARARSIRIEIDYGPRYLTVQVVDDGIGIEHARESRGSAPGLGLVGMYERAAQIGGTLTMEAAPEGGTIISLRVPGRSAYGFSRLARRRDRKKVSTA